MAVLVPIHQKFFDDNRPGRVLCLTQVKLVSTSDTLPLPTLSNSTSAASVKQLLRANDPTVTVTSSVTASSTSGLPVQTVTLAGTPGDEVLIVSLHMRTDFNSEETE